MIRPRWHLTILAVLAVGFWLSGCGGSESSDNGGDGDASVTDGDGTVIDPEAGVIVQDGGVEVHDDGGTWICQPTTCS